MNTARKATAEASARMLTRAREFASRTSSEVYEKIFVECLALEFEFLRRTLAGLTEPELNAKRAADLEKAIRFLIRLQLGSAMAGKWKQAQVAFDEREISYKTCADLRGDAAGSVARLFKETIMKQDGRLDVAAERYAEWLACHPDEVISALRRIQWQEARVE